MFTCCFYEELQQQYLDQIDIPPGREEQDVLCFLLEGKVQGHTCMISK